MKLLINVFFVISLIFIGLDCKSQSIENVYFEQKSDKIYIYYDLIGTKKISEFNVGVVCKDKSGNQIEINKSSLSGDHGTVSSGKNKMIVWDVLQDKSQSLSGYYKFKVFANPIDPIQDGYKNRHRHWKITRYELFSGVGCSFFMGDVGGSSDYKSKGLRDIQLRSFRPSFVIGTRYKLLERLAISVRYKYSRLVSDDENSKSAFERNRNLAFYANTSEFSLVSEFSILKENRGRRYLFQKSSILNNMNLFVYGGAGVFTNNPKIKINDEVFFLNSLGTEGQGINNVPNVKKYAFCFPVGIGFKYFLTKHWSAGFNLNYNFTSTNYMDNVGGTYYDNNEIEQVYGSIAAQLADRRIDPEKEFPEIDFPDNTQDYRGYPDKKDKYGNIFFVLTYTFENRSRNRAKFFDN